MDSLVFLVQGSSPEPYRLVCERDKGAIGVYCSCPAGELRQICKHKLSVLSGSMEAVVSGTRDDLEVLLGWLPGTALEAALNRLEEAERQLEASKAQLAIARKSLARACVVPR